MIYIVYIVGTWLLMGTWAGAEGKQKGDSYWKWFAAGALFGPIGVFFAYHAGATCAVCKGKVNPQATICRHCRSPLVLDPLPSNFSITGMLLIAVTIGATIAFGAWVYSLPVNP